MNTTGSRQRYAAFASLSLAAFSFGCLDENSTSGEYENAHQELAMVTRLEAESGRFSNPVAGGNQGFETCGDTLNPGAVRTLASLGLSGGPLALARPLAGMIITGPTNSVSSVWDERGDQTKVVYPSGRTIFRAHDEEQRLSLVQDAAGSNTIASYSYHGDLLERRITGNGTTFLPTYDQAVLGLGAVAAGGVLSAMSIGWPLASAVSARFFLRFGFRDTELIGAGTCLAAIVFFLLTTGYGQVWQPVVSTFVLGFGLGLISVCTLVGPQSTVTWEQRGVVTGTVMFCRFLGQSVGAAITGVPPAFHQACALELVDCRDHRTRVDAGALSELVLGDRTLGVEHVERAPHAGVEPQLLEPLRELLHRDHPHAAQQEARVALERLDIVVAT